MARKKPFIDDVLLSSVDEKGNAYGSFTGTDGENKEIFLEGRLAIPGDRVNVQGRRKKKGRWYSQLIDRKENSPHRIDARCRHFGICGGCTWQQMDYQYQLIQKKAIVIRCIEQIFTEKMDRDSLEDLLARVKDTIPAEDQFFYRNKMEYSFSSRRWFEETLSEEKISEDKRALGLFVPKQTHRVLHLQECYLQDSRIDEVRHFIHDYAMKNDYSYHNALEHSGELRTLLVRVNKKEQVQLSLIFGWITEERRNQILQALKDRFPWIHSIYYLINEKFNDSYQDLPAHFFSGDRSFIEELGLHRFIIHPTSFFQTNSKMAERLYQLIHDKVPDDTKVLYDLYTGTGSIASFVSDRAKKVVGIEYVESAIQDARINAEQNGLMNLQFFAGDMREVLSQSFIDKQGRPDCIITDPPRAGMHPDVVQRILECGANRIIYVSCNPKSLARDLEPLLARYQLVSVQPIDLTPQSPHIESVAVLDLLLSEN